MSISRLPALWQSVPSEMKFAICVFGYLYMGIGLSFFYPRISVWMFGLFFVAVIIGLVGVVDAL